MLTIGETPIADPSAFSVDIHDIDGETMRNAKGTLLRDRVAVKRKLNLEWPALTMTEISTILSAVTSVFFDVTYPDPLTGSVAETKTFYVGDRSTPLLRKNYNGQYLWEGLKMNFIEK